MPRGASYGTERIDRIDESTGLLVRQITSFPTISLHLHYETPTFTPDGRRMIFVSMRLPQRGAPWDLFTCQSDGQDIVQLSDDEPQGMSCASLSRDGQYAFYMHGGTAHRTRLDDAEDVEIGHVDGARHHGYYRGSRSFDGRWYISMVRTKEGNVALVRWDLRTGEHTIALEANGFNHPKANPGGPEFQVAVKRRQPDGSEKVEHVCLNIGTLEPVTLRFNRGKYETAHNCWLGRTGKYHATLKPPGHGVILMTPDGEAPELVAEGPYFWHSGSSYDGNWVVADTNWPDEGLWLINVETKKRERLCFTGTSAGHPQPTHNHANMDENGAMAVFTSDRTGITQVYVVYVPDQMRERLSKRD